MQDLIRIPCAAQDGAEGFTSPYRKISHIGDPFVLYNAPEKKYYMYCTGRGHYPCWSSEDFSSWTPLGDAYRVTEDVLQTGCRPLVDKVCHGGRRGDGVNARDFSKRIGYMSRSIVAVHGFKFTSQFNYLLKVIT